MLRTLALALAACALAGVGVPRAEADVLQSLEPQMAFQWAQHEMTADGSVTRGKGLATVGLVTGDEQIVTDGDPDPEYFPSWSPDGRSLLFARGVTSVAEDSIVVRDVATGTESVLAHGYAPSWSPDGRRIAYSRGTPGGDGSDTELIIAEIEPADSGWRIVSGSEVRVPLPQFQFRVTWSPQSDRLGFAVRRDDDEWAHCDLWSIAADGSGLHRLTSGVDGNPAPPKWSVSGQYLAFKVDDRTWFMESNGADQHPATNDTFDEGGDWSPIADVYAVGVHGASEIALTTPTTGEVLRIAPPNQRSIFQVAWMPTGTALAFTAQEWPSAFGAPLYWWSVPAEGGEPRRISDSTVAPYGTAVMSPGLVVRLFGATRVETAVSLSRETFARADAVVLAPAQTAVHALLAGPLASKVGGPLLLTEGETLEADVAAELNRLGAGDVWVIGDSAAISDGVEHQLDDRGIVVHRVDEANPDLLSSSIAALLPGAKAYAVHVDDASTGWADAVSISALAAKQQRPILLVDYDSVPRPTLEAIRDGGITHVTVVGGTAVVSDATVRDLEAAGVRASRLAGRDRYATSAVVADASLAVGLSQAQPLLATGRNWPDSLTAGPAAAASNRVLLLIDGADAERTTATRTWLAHRAGSYAEVGIAGGAAAIAPDVEAALEGLITD